MRNSFFFRWVSLPALFAIVLTSQTMAAEFHVTDATGFQNALDTAETNGQDDTIYLAAGIYYGGFWYSPPETEHKSLTIRGELGTSAKDIILDGQNSFRVLGIKDLNDNPIADIAIDGITVQNGYADDANGGGIYVDVNEYNITISNCIIRGNRGGGNGGGVMMENSSHAAGVLTLENNLIIDNTITSTTHWARAFGGGVRMYNGYGIHIIRNNIIAWNTAQGISPRGGGLWVGHAEARVAHFFGNTIYGNQANEGGGIYLPFGEIVNVYNNIIYGNTASEGGDICFRYVETNNGYNNNYSTMSGTWTASGGNLNTDPLFVLPKNNDYHLRPNSPMVNAGKSDVPSPPGHPVTDFEGDPRSYGEAPDMGADEYAGDKYYPEEGTFGTQIALLGSGFGSRKGKVLVGSSALKVLEWTEETIRCQLAKALEPGTYNLTVQPKGTDQIVIDNGFTVKAPEIRSINPTSGSAGDEITIYGSFFGTKKGKVRLEEKNCRIKTWTMNPTTGESEIHFVVPRGLSAGTHELKVTNGGESDTADFGVD